MLDCARINHIYKILIIFSILGIDIAGYSTASALTYQNGIGVNFSFNQSLGLALSSSDIHIYDLAPGAADDSNIVTINVMTNSLNGYTLNASVGNSSTFNTRNLINETNAEKVFSSINYTTTPTITSNTNLDPDTWGYSFSTDSGSTWEKYNGLPLYSDTEHIATLKTSSGPTASTSGDNIQFKIAAKASNGQVSGSFNNVINFTLVAAPVPTTLAMAYENADKPMHQGYYKMQDMTPEICSSVEVLNDQLKVIDIRDNKTYWISKLADGKCWMTQNLDLDLDSNVTYTHADTDLGWGDVIDTTATWRPLASTYKKPNGRITSYNDLVDAGWGYDGGRNLMQSLDPDDLYWSGTAIPTDTVPQASCGDAEEGFYYCQNSNPWAFYNAGVTSGDDHYMIGNYYNFLAAVAKNNTSELCNNDNCSEDFYSYDTSICPAGWKLPDQSIEGQGDFDNLLKSYNYNYTTYEPYELGVRAYNSSGGQNLTAAPLYISLSGDLSREGEAFPLSTGVAGYSSLLSNTHSPEGYDIISILAVFELFDDEDYNTTFYGAGSSRGSSIRCVAR